MADTNERLPDFFSEDYDLQRTTALKEVVERRLDGLGEAVTEIQLANSGIIGSETFAPISHTHGISEITDFPADNLTVSNFPSNINLGNIGDVDLAGLQNNYIIKYSLASNTWIVDDIASAGTSLAGLLDTTIINPQEADVIVYDDASNKWVNAGGATLPYVRRTGDTMTGTLLFNDLVKASFGDAAEADIYFDGATLKIESGLNIELIAAFTELGIRVVANGAVQQFHNNEIATQTTDNGMVLFGEAAGDPDASAVQDSLLQLFDSSSFEVGRLGFANPASEADTTTLYMVNRVWSGDTLFQGTNASGVPASLAQFNPDGAATLYNDGDQRIQTTSTGGITFGTVLDIDNSGVSSAVELRAYNSVGGYALQVDATTADLTFFHTNSAGIHGETWSTAERDGPFTGYFDDTPAFRSALDSLEIREDGAAWLDIEHAGGGSTGIGPYTYESTTSAPPSSGEIRFDNASIGSATNMYVHDTNADSVDVSNFLALFDDGAIFYIQESRDSRRWVAVEISSATDNTTYWTFGIQAVDVGSVALRDGNAIDFLGCPAGGGGGGNVDVGTTTSSTLRWDGVDTWVENTSIVANAAAQMDFDSASQPRIRFFESATLSGGLGYDTTANRMYMEGRLASEGILFRKGGFISETMMELLHDLGVHVYFNGSDVWESVIGGWDTHPASGELAIGQIIGLGTDIDANLKLRADSGGVQFYWDESALTAGIAQTDASGSFEENWFTFADNGAVTGSHNGTTMFRSAARSATGDQFPGAFEINRGSAWVAAAVRQEAIRPVDVVGSGDATKTFTSGNYAGWITYYIKTDTTAVTINVIDSTDSELVGTSFLVSNEGASADVTVQRDGGSSTVAFSDGTTTGSTSITVAAGEDKEFIRYANNAYRVLDLT